MLGRVELSQVNVFGIILVALCGIKKPGAWPRENRTIPYSWALGFCGAIFLFYTVLHWFEYASLNANAYDFTYVEQSIWKTAFLWPKGLAPFLGSSMPKAGTYLGEHAAFIFAALVPLYRLIDTPFHMAWVPALLLAGSLLLCISVMARTSGGPPEKRISLRFFLMILFFSLTPSFRGGASFQFREDVFFLPLGILILSSILSGRLLLYLLCTLALFTVKENAAFLSVPFALWILFQLPGETSKRANQWRGAALAVILFSAFAFYLWNFVIAPKIAGPQDQVMMARRLNFLGLTSEGLFQQFLREPFGLLERIFKYIFDLKSLKYGLLVFGPYLFFIPFMVRKQPFLFFSSVALWFLNLLFTPRSTDFHYDLIFLPLLWGALMLAYYAPSTQRQKTPQTVWLFLGLFCFFGRSPVLLLRTYWPTTQKTCVRNLLENVPKSFAVATQGALMPVLHRRDKVMLLRQLPEGSADFIAFSKMENINHYAAEGLHEVSGQLHNGNHRNFFPLLLASELELWCRTDHKIQCQEWIDHFQWDESGGDSGSCSSLSDAIALTKARAADTKVQ